jgi:hypothetical protein
MAGKKKKDKKKNGGGEKKAKKPAAPGGGGGGGKKDKSKSRMQVDIFNESAMLNAYYTCHNVQDLLKIRGFPWPNAQKKKKGKK